MLYAQNTHALLIIFQAMDAAGKDSTIKHVMSGINPQGCQVYSFKAPSVEELDHGYLWRCFKALPERGRIGIFNRSYYEEILITRVHPEILEQRKRFLKRIDRPEKNWKFSASDAWERTFWNDYMAVYEDMFNHTSTEWAPWYVISADHKWFTRLVVAGIIYSN
jgi:polyphosphate kinase 2 (PPK2 family)